MRWVLMKSRLECTIRTSHLTYCHRYSDFQHIFDRSIAHSNQLVSQCRARLQLSKIILGALRF